MRRRALITGLAATAMARQAHSTVQASELTLTLALDFSGSVHQGSVRHPDGRRQTHYFYSLAGHAAALADPQIGSLLVQSRAIVRAIIWSEPGKAQVLVSDHIIDSPASAAAFGQLLVEAGTRLHESLHKLQLSGGTRHDTAMELAYKLGATTNRHVVDIFSDGAWPPDRAEKICLDMRNLLEQAGIVVNVLAINPPGTSSVADSLRRLVMTKTGFTLSIEGWESFFDAIRDKLIRELSIA